MNKYQVISNYFLLSEENKITAERLLKLSSKKRLLLNRGKEWLIDKSMSGNLRLILNNKNLVGLFCLTPFFNEQFSRHDVYGEACVCRMKTTNIIEILRDVIKIEAKRMGNHLYGFYFSGNAFSEQLFAMNHDFHLIDLESLPDFVSRYWVKDLGGVNAFDCDVQRFVGQRTGEIDAGDYVYLDTAS